jgi:predicted RNA-binding protein with PIN domain
MRTGPGELNDRCDPNDDPDDLGVPVDWNGALAPDGPGERMPGAGWWGVLETLAVVATFASFGLAWAEIETRASGEGPSYAHPVAVEVKSLRPTPSTWLIDGFNVLHTSLLGGRDRNEWWTGARRDELLERVARFDDPRAEVWVVFDGPRPEAADTAGAHPGDEPGDERPRRVFATSADAWLVAQVRASEDPERIAVVTADRQVASRVRQRGAQVHSPRDFLARCSG